jgi:DNA-binding transcriptional regulator YhcF (GntR family)
MVQLWFIHSGEISLCEQMVTQLRMAVLSGELKPGERLPSVRALGRRYTIHHNTVSAAYQKLQQAGWVEMRHGSGVYVREASTTEAQATEDRGDAQTVRELSVNRMIAALLAAAREVGMAPQELQERLKIAADRSQVKRLAWIEPDAALREIVLAELKAAVSMPIDSQPMPASREAALELDLNYALALVMPSKAATLRALLPEGTPVLVLRIGSAAESLTRYLPAPKTSLVGIASGWPQFLEVARTMVVSAGVDEDALLIRDTRAPGWLVGLEATAGVVCDTLTAASVDVGVPVLVFRLVANASIAELKEIEEGALGL